jgi:hypothetical protein
MLHVVHLTEGRPRHAVRAVGKQSSGLRILAVSVIVVAALCFGREVFAPLALAIPLSFARGSFVMLLRRKLPGAKILVGFCTLIGEGVEFRHALSATGADFVVTSPRKADDQIAALRENLRTTGP